MRELRNVIERAVVLAGAKVVDVTHLPEKIVANTQGRATPSAGPADDDTDRRSLRGDIEDLERKRIVEALEHCGGNQTAAASVLGMSRRTLVSRLSAYALPRPRKRPT